MLNLEPSPRRFSARPSPGWTAACLFLFSLLAPILQAQRHTLETHFVDATLPATDQATTVDLGPVPASQPLHITLYLTPPAARQAALDQQLSDLIDPSSPSYHKWLTPQQFAEQFGATDDQIASAKTWAEAQGLTVESLAPSHTRLTLTGTAAQIQSAFAVPLHAYARTGAATPYLANTARPSIPLQIKPLIAAVSGLNTLPPATPTTLSRIATTGQSTILTHSEPLDAAASAIDANTSAVLTLDTAACSSHYSAADYAAYRALFRQANAQGISILATSACGARGTGSFPASLPEVTALAIEPDATTSFTGIAVRPEWQLAPGLPADANRVVPDLTTSAISDFAQTLASILRQGAERQGNINRTLYALATTPGLYTQPVTAPAGTWQPTTGLGTVDLKMLAKVFPRALTPSTTTLSLSPNPPPPGSPITLTASVSATGTAIPTGTITFADNGTFLSSAVLIGGSVTFTGTITPGKHSFTATYSGDTVYGNSISPAIVASGGTVNTSATLVSSSYSVNYGQPFSLTSAVIPSSVVNNASPTGTVTFTASTQGVLGTANLVNGSAKLDVGTLNVGTYNLTASYAGDSNYGASTSATSVVVTVSIVNGNLIATVAPTADIPYGSTATVTATVTLPNTSAAPSGTVSAQVEGVTGAVDSATLSPNPGGNSATANIVVSVPPPGKYTVQVTCAGNQNFQCQTPVNLGFNTVKGNTVTSLTVTPAAPQAGQPISLTATIINAGNGSGIYTFNGSVSFYDSGKLIATSAVGTNQATTTLTLAGNRNHNIVAIYTGDGNWNTSTSTGQAVQPSILPSSLNITTNVPNLTTALAGVNLVFTSTVTTTAVNNVGPTGTVLFYDTFNGSVLQLGSPATLVSNGPTASIGIFSTTGLLAGVHSIYAVYSGDANYAPATSPILIVNLSDYNVTMVPQTLTIAQGQTGQAVMLLGLVGGFTGTVSFGCTPPAGSQTTCSFSPTSLTGGGTTTMKITTTAASAKPTTQSRNRPLWGLSSTCAIALLIGVFTPRRRRSLPNLLALLFAVLLAANVGCGIGIIPSGLTGDSNPSNPGSPLGTQNFNITTAGTDGISTVRHNYQFQVTIQ